MATCRNQPARFRAEPQREVDSQSGNPMPEIRQPGDRLGTKVPSAPAHAPAASASQTRACRLLCRIVWGYHAMTMQHPARAPFDLPDEMEGVGVALLSRQLKVLRSNACARTVVGSQAALPAGLHAQIRHRLAGIRINEVVQPIPLLGPGDAWDLWIKRLEYPIGGFLLVMRPAARYQ